MKIERGQKRSDAGSGAARAARREDPGAVAPKFVDAITAANQSVVERDRDELFAQIEEQAKILVKKRTLPEMMKYRELIAAFMKSVIGDSLAVKEITSARFCENNKVFIIARKIEERILEMADKIKDKTADALALTAATSEIRGLLMDLKI